jgi:hypothetical protein
MTAMTIDLNVAIVIAALAALIGMAAGAIIGACIMWGPES